MIQFVIYLSCAGVDDLDSYSDLCKFIHTVSQSGTVSKFIIHARKCLLNGLTPKQNRDVPPLRYHVGEWSIRDEMRWWIEYRSDGMDGYGYEMDVKEWVYIMIASNSLFIYLMFSSINQSNSTIIYLLIYLQLSLCSSSVGKGLPRADIHLKWRHPVAKGCEGAATTIPLHHSYIKHQH